MENNEDIFITKDLHFAAFLKLTGVFLKRLERHNVKYKDKNPVFFHFENRARCEELETAFWNGVGDDIMVNVKDYVSAVKDLRARIASVTVAETVGGFYK